MSTTPDNVTLTPTRPHHQIDVPPGGGSLEFPKAVYHKDSKPGALVTRLVESADELKALGKDWVALKDLNIETAPAAEGN
jgi:hypothetical protein